MLKSILLLWSAKCSTSEVSEILWSACEDFDDMVVFSNFRDYAIDGGV